MDKEGKTRELAARINNLRIRERRYPVIMVVPENQGEDWDDVFRQTALEVGGTYINYLLDVMDSDNPPVIGAFNFRDLIDWMKLTAQKKGPLLVTHIDPMITTWNEKFRIAFYNELLKTELPCNCPIVTISPMGKEYEVSHEDRGQGVVLDGKLETLRR